MSDPQIEGMKAEIARLSKENETQREAIKHRDAIIASYRRWIAECPIAPLERS